MPVDRFPYLVFYVERVDHVDVWRVLHTLELGLDRAENAEPVPLAAAGGRVIVSGTT